VLCSEVSGRMIVKTKNSTYEISGRAGDNWITKIAGKHDDHMEESFLISDMRPPQIGQRLLVQIGGEYLRTSKVVSIIDGLVVDAQNEAD